MQPFSKKQLEFMVNATKPWNLCHGAVRTGKTVGSLFSFLHAVNDCPNSEIYMVGHKLETIYDNAIKLIFETPQFAIFRPFCTWYGGTRHELKFKDKVIKVLGAKDEGALGNFQGKTMTLLYADEMTLYPDSIIQMIDTRLSRPISKGWATMNPSYPTHIIKQWIDKAEAGDPKYYALHFELEDNPYVNQDYKDRIKNSLSGLFYKRNYLGQWCMADGAIFDFFDAKYHTVAKPPRCADYWIAGIDYGTSNNFACVLIGISTGVRDQIGPCRWVEKEYVWDSKKMERQKTNFEYADDVQAFLEPYSLKGIYMDPSAASFKLELQRRGMHIIDADNDVIPGITHMTSEMAKGNLFVCRECKETIREIETYAWDSKYSAKGEDKPLKKDDHCLDGLRYACYTHKISVYDPYKDKSKNEQWLRNKYEPSFSR